MSTQPTGNDQHFPPVFTPNTRQSNKDAILELAAELAYNYFTNSFGDYNTEIANCDHIFKQFELGPNNNLESFKERFKKNERVRNVIVVGAGASYDAYKAIPTGDGLIEEIRDVYETDIKTIPFLRNKFEELESEIKDITGLDKLTFENYLYLLSKLFVTSTDLRNKIKEMTGVRYSVSLVNEIIAHLLKHAFVDIVINFNFEETLDQIIEEEIGTDNYHNIISDGNCVDLDQVLVDGRLKMPIYIKPHGTHSHKSTLRFTNKHYFDLPGDIKTMLSGLLHGTCGDRKEIQRVNLIFVGFAIESIEFNKIINEQLPAESVIYHLDYKPCANGKKFFSGKRAEVFDGFVRRAAQHSRKKDDCYKSITTSGYSQNDPKNNGLDRNMLTSTFGELFSVLWRLQSGIFRKTYKPRSIARHEIISYLFYRPELGLQTSPIRNLAQRIDERGGIQNNIESHPKYFRNRVLIELLLSLNRNNGILDIAEIMKGRVGLYFKKYLAACKKGTVKSISRTHTIYELLEVFFKEPSSSATLMLEIKEFDTGKNLFILQSDFEKEHFVDPNKFKRQVISMLEKLDASLSEVKIPDGETITIENLKALRENFLKNFYGLLLGWYNSVIDRENSLNEQMKFGRTVTLFCRLFGSRMASNYFKYSFLQHHDKIVYNGRREGGLAPFDKEQPIMLYELFRLLNKSYNNYYYIIDSKPSDPVHHIWESFSRRKVIHTNLGRSAEFNHTFLNKDWDVLLSVTETGSLLDSLRFLDQKNSEKFKRKHFVIICSYEAVRQLYPDVEGIYNVLEAHRMHLQKAIKDEKDLLIPTDQITLLALPFNQHNHHFSIFLDSLALEKSSLNNIRHKSTIITNQRSPDGGVQQDGPDGDVQDATEYAFNAIGSFYLYRLGFSNHVDPIYIGTADKESTTDEIYRDQSKLLESFVSYLNRAFKFEVFAREPDEKLWPKPKMVMELQEAWEKRRLKTKAKSAEKDVKEDKVVGKDITKRQFLEHVYNFVTKK